MLSPTGSAIRFRPRSSAVWVRVFTGSVPSFSTVSRGTGTVHSYHVRAQIRPVARIYRQPRGESATPDSSTCPACTVSPTAAQVTPSSASIFVMSPSLAATMFCTSLSR